MPIWRKVHIKYKEVYLYIIIDAHIGLYVCIKIYNIKKY